MSSPLHPCAQSESWVRMEIQQVFAKWQTWCDTKETAMLCWWGVIRSMRGKENYFIFLALGNLPDVLFALINFLALLPGAVAII